MDESKILVRAWKQARKEYVQIDLHLPHIRNVVRRRVRFLRRQSASRFQTQSLQLRKV